ncbi:PRD domain-containing protein [Streptococcus sp. CSL10205-OR2]|uniref:PRD domain-containing protein n=1 Tax=Streptococcus sp. CSL10205-OR2 TaxID=2980558 RepID=UPI0021DB4562|nr:PRD domain-containing protein [Streptococcus sp. CSL10205-OR2]MCU9534031.1 PRD domain-containing protein [Streptococcus sp. CSL10205-OR2]
MYRIVKLLNNNVALVKDEQGLQAVVMGNGIAFQKKKGDLLSERQIEKVFSLNSSESQENFLTLLKNIPLDFITVTYSVINELSKTYNYPVQEYLYVTLTDHIYCSYKGIIEGRYEESHLPDMSKDYPLEYLMAKEALAIFREKLLSDFPDDELGRILLHFLNAKSVDTSQPSLKNNPTQNIIAIVQKELAQHHIKRTKENSSFYDRLMVHLTYFVEAINKREDDDMHLMDMDAHIKEAYPKAYEIGSRIYEVIASEFGVDLSQGERFYLVLHVQRLLS